MFSTRRLFLVAAIVLMCGPARASEVIIDDPRWELLSPEDRAEIEKTLKDSKAVGENDQLVYKAKPKTSASQQNSPQLILSKAAEAKRTIVRQVSYWVSAQNLSSCKSGSDSAAKKSCRDNENARYKEVKKKIP